MAVKKPFITWQDSYSVGINLVDEQHKHLINLTNKLFDACMAGKDKSKNVFFDTIREAVDYVSYHFSTEEKVMAEVSYPHYGKHRQEHAYFVREVFKKADDYNSGRLFAPLSFVYFLRDWILHHIAISDKKMGDYLLGLQKTGALNKITVKVKKDETTSRILIQ